MSHEIAGSANRVSSEIGDSADREGPQGVLSQMHRSREVITCLAGGEAFIAGFSDCWHEESGANPKAVLALAEKHQLEPTTVGKIIYDARDSERAQTKEWFEQLGACLGHHHDFWKRVVAEYPLRFNFVGQSIVDAMRWYLWFFKLPGESAQIERILGGFAKSFFLQNQLTPQADTEQADTAGRLTPQDSVQDSHSVEPSARGWYIKQPGKMCISCGKTAPRYTDANACYSARIESLNTCQACKLVAFCHTCSRHAGAYGHAIRCTIGYGRACVAATLAAGLDIGNITYKTFGSLHSSLPLIEGNEYLRPDSWPRTSPFASEDSVMVLSYAIMMLNTDLHNSKVKNKMTMSQFLSSCRGTNDGGNFPGDFLGDIYEVIASDELKMRYS